MKSLFPKPIFKLSFFTSNPQNCFQIAHFSTNFQNQAQSTYPSRRHEEESRNVKVSVWWDFENCAPPAGVNVFKIAQSITAAIRANGIKGPVHITAFGDVLQLSRGNQEALSSTGINLAHVPNGGKNSADRSLLVDLMYWVSQNPPPAHLFLISGDRDFAGILHRLRMNNYNILLASKETAPSVLCSAASIMWQWNALLKGENLIGKHFNQPPDGPYGSWYGHYKAPLEDPFAVTEPPAHAFRAEESLEAVSDLKPRPIPRSVVKEIRHILGSYPKGISITDLRAEFAKSNLNLDKEYYGYKKFSRFLLSMPSILKLHAGSDGKYLVRSVNPKVSEQSDEPETNGEAEIAATSPTLNGETEICVQRKDDKSFPPQMKTIPPRKLPKVQEVSTEVTQPLPAKVLEPTSEAEPTVKIELSPSVKNVDAKASEGQLLVSEEQSSERDEMGFLKRLRNWWFGNDETDAREKISNEKSKSVEKDVKLKSYSEQLEDPAFAPPGIDTNYKDEAPMHSEDTVKKPSQESSLFSQVKNWFTSWRSSKLSDESGLASLKELKQTENCPGVVELFSKESFWRELGSFLITSQGSVIVLQSRTRAQMAQNLQKEGLSFLNSLGEGDVLRLVGLLISDKKWVEESLSRTFPYKLYRPAVKASLTSDSSTLNGLTSIPNMQRSQKLDGEKRHQNPPHTGVSQPVVQGTCCKSRSEVLIDCQKLVDYVVKQYPDGYNMGAFRKLFLDRYGYSLDVNKLGYVKLVNLLQIMPGIKIESNYMIPAKVLKIPGQKPDEPSDQESDLSGSEAHLDSKGNEFDSPFEELGPVSKAGLSKLGFNGKVKDESSEQVHNNYEAPLDQDFSDSDEENSASMKSKNGKSKGKEEDSSLLQILDSWYSRKDGSEDVEGMVESSTNGSRASRSVSVDKMENSLLGRRQRTYSFVTDQSVDNKDKLIDGILGSLKKSGDRSSESRVQV